MYPEEITSPMRAELTSVGFKELISADDAEGAIKESGTTLVLINSVCGCAAGTARPGVKASLGADKKPDHITTAFAGVHPEAVNKVRENCMPYPPSSPSIALFKDGELKHFVERHHIEGRTAEMIADHLKQVYNEYC